MLYPGICSVALRHLEPADVVAAAAKSQAVGIEWEARRHVPPGDVETAEKVGQLTRDAGCCVVSYGSYVRAGTQSCAQEFAACLASAIALGAPVIRVWAGIPNTTLDQHTAKDLRNAVADLKMMCATARKHDIDISVEFHPNSLTHGPVAALELIELADEENLFLHWQPDYGEPIETALKSLAAVSKHLSHIHVFNWNEGCARFPLSEAKTYWVRLFEQAPRQNRFQQRRFAFVEFVPDDTPAQIISEIAVLTAWLTAVQGSAT